MDLSWLSFDHRISLLQALSSDTIAGPGAGKTQPPPRAATFDEALPEIDRTLVENFAVGGCHYTDLQHAIAQARRARAAQSITNETGAPDGQGPETIEP